MDHKQCDLNFFVATLERNNYKSTTIHELLVEAWGEEAVVGVRRIQAIAKEFSEGREGIKRQAGSGRPRTSTSPENVEIVRQLIEDNNTLSCPEIEAMTGIEERSVQRILTKSLHKKSLYYRWVPHALTEHNKENRVECAREILRTLDRRLMKEKLIVLDEKWVYLRSVRPKECQRAWVDGAGDRPQQARRTIIDRKVMVIVASNYSKSFSYIEVLHDGGSINADRYLVFLQNMFTALERHLQLPHWELHLQHDNARPHVAIIVRNWLAAERINLLEQPPYSPDFNLMDRYLFRNYEVYRSGVDFDNSNDVEANINDFITNLTANKLQKEFQQLKIHLANVIEAAGDYV